MEQRKDHVPVTVKNFRILAKPLENWGDETWLLRLNNNTQESWVYFRMFLFPFDMLSFMVVSVSLFFVQ